MPSLHLDFSACGGPDHTADIASFEQRGLAVPHQYSSWHSNDSVARWLWVRVIDNDAGLRTGFAVASTSSRLIPGTRIARIERLGRRLHEDTIPLIGQALGLVAEKLRWLQRLDVQVFDEDPDRRRRMGEAILAAGSTRILPPRDYSRTILLPLHRSREEFLASLGSSARRNIRAFLKSPSTSTGPICSKDYLDRVVALYKGAFQRTGSEAPAIRVEDLFRDSLSGSSSILVGAFIKTRQPPDDLVGFAWSRYHGDHVCYDIAAMDREADLGRLSPGYALIDQIADWGRSRGASWMDLGGIIGPDEAPDHPLRGITGFKQTFSRTDAIVADEYRFIPRTLTAATAKVIRQTLSRLRGR